MSSAPTDWTKAAALVEQLEGLVASSVDGSTTPAIAKAARAINVVHRRPHSMSAKAWRQHLSKQVFQKLVKACVKALSTALATSSTSTSTSGSEASASVCCLAVVLGLLNRLVRAAEEDLCRPTATSNGERAVSADATAFAQQFSQASGLLQLLPQLFDSLTQQLQTVTGLTAELKPLGKTPQAAQDDNGVASSSSQPAQGLGGLPAPDGSHLPVAPVDSMLSFAVRGVLRLHARLADLWPCAVFVTELVPLCTPKVLQLSWLVTKFLSQQLPAVDAPACLRVLVSIADHWTAVLNSIRAVMDPVAAYQHGHAACSARSAEQHKVLLLSSPHTMPCLALVIVTGTYSMLLAQLPALPTLPTSAAAAAGSGTDAASSSSSGGGSGGGGQPTSGSHSSNTNSSSAASGRASNKPRAGGSTSSSRGRSSHSSHSPGNLGFDPLPLFLAKPGGSKLSEEEAATAAAWRPTCKEVSRVPTTHRLLMEQLGISPAFVVFCAAALNEPFRSGVHGITGVYSRLYQDLHCCDLLFIARPSAATAVSVAVLLGLPDAAHFQPTPPAQLQLCMLLCAELFWWAAHQPAHVGSTTETASCASAMECASKALSAATSVSAVCEHPPVWLQQLVREEVPPLARVVAASILTSVGCGGVVASLGLAGSSSSGSGSSSSSSNSSAPTVASTTPINTTLQLSHMLETLGAVGKEQGVLLGLLVEVPVRAPEKAGWAILPNMLKELKARLSSTISRGSSGGASSGGSGGSSRGALLAAAQVQGAAAPAAMTTEQLHLASLCFSVLKMLTTLSGTSPYVRNSPTTLECCQLVADAASSMLCWLCDSASSSSSAAGGSSWGVDVMVPWLVLSGRVLTFVTSAAGRFDRQGPGQQSADTVVAGLRAWLETAGAADALTAAAYDPSGALLQQLRAVCGDQQRDSRLQPETLQSLGHSLNTLPFACACNNPACANLSGPLELQLVNGKGCVCSGCHVSRFCSRACQVQFWKQGHRPVCRAVAAAVGVASAAQAASGAPASQG